jgi:hypothetical protein
VQVDPHTSDLSRCTRTGLILTTGASCQELCQLRVSSYEPVSLLTAVTAVEADCDGATGPTEHPPQAPSVFPAAQQGDEIRAVLHTTCIPCGAAPTMRT